MRSPDLVGWVSSFNPTLSIKNIEYKTMLTHLHPKIQHRYDRDHFINPLTNDTHIQIQTETCPSMVGRQTRETQLQAQTQASAIAPLEVRSPDLVGWVEDTKPNII